MSFTRHRFISLVLSDVAAAALLAAAVSAALPAAPAAAATCDSTPTFIGLHGMNEGPSSALSVGPHGSWETLSFDYAQNQISGAVLFQPITYPDVSLRDIGSLLLAPNSVTYGEHVLDQTIKADTANCTPAQDHIALVGYSMGAWVINMWMTLHRPEWPMIKAVVLFGDPCWHNGSYNGLVRRYGVGIGCVPEANYPYPAARANVPFGVQSWSTSKDPVTGQGWSSSIFTLGEQLGAAIACGVNLNPATCSHLDYVTAFKPDAPGPAIDAGAQFVVSQLIG